MDESPSSPISMPEFLDSVGALYAVVCDATGDVWRVFGDASKLTFRGILQTYLPGPWAAAALHGLVADAPLPQLVGQGRVSCAICKRSDGLVVAVVRNTDDPVLERVSWSRDVQRDIDTVDVGLLA